jgi:hypothetical protein
MQYLIKAFPLYTRFPSRATRVCAHVVRADRLLLNSDLTESKVVKGERTDKSVLESIFCVVRQEIRTIK